MNALITANEEKKKLNIKTLAKEADEIIEKIGTSKFGVPTASELKTNLYFEVERLKQQGKTPDMTIFYIDLDNLKTINRIQGEEKADQYIKELIEKYKQLGIEIGKDNNSDELIGVLRGEQDKEEKERIKSELSNCDVGTLSGSVGYSNEFEEGIGKTIQQAEEKMAKDKREKKRKELEEFVGEENLEEYIKQIFEKMLDRLRIDVEELDEYEKKILEKNIIGNKDRKTFVKTIEQDEKKKKDLMDSVQTAKKDEIIIDPLFERIRKMEQEFDLETSNQLVDPEVREKIILARILKESPMLGVKQEYFDQIESKKGFRKNNLFTHIALARRGVLTAGLSNIKGVNEVKGHMQCDEEITEAITKTQKILADNGIKPEVIIANGVSDTHFLIKKQEQQQMQEVIKKIEAISTDLYLAAAYEEMNTQIGKAKKNTPIVKNVRLQKNTKHESYRRIVNSAESKNKRIIKKKHNNRKVTDIVAIENQKKQILRDLYYSNVFELYAEKLGKTKEEILDENFLKVLYPAEEQTIEPKDKTQTISKPEVEKEEL